MEPIYVTGHRNPDTDSIVAAIAYASLRNALGDREYEAACLGRVSDETQMVLNHFGFAPPTLISNVYTQVQDLEFDKPPILSAAVTVGRAWKQLQERKEMHAIPVANDDGTLFGMMSREDIASYNMELNNACVLDKVPLFNVLSVLEGKVINEAGEYLDTVSGEVILAIPESRGPSLFSNSNCVVICGNQPDLIRQALERNVNCLVLCRTELDPELLKIETKTCIISTPCDAYRATRLIFQSAPIGRICRTKDLVCFHLNDRLDHVKEQVLKYRESCYLNQIDGIANAAPLYLDPAKHYTEDWNNEKVTQYLGIDLSNLGSEFEYIGEQNHTVTYRNDGTLVRDLMGFSYKYSGSEFTVAVSKLSLPYDCIYALEESKKTNVGTEKGSVEVLFAGAAGGENATENQTLIVADFELNGVNYRVKAENISLTSFYNFVRSILNK